MLNTTWSSAAWNQVPAHLVAYLRQEGVLPKVLSDAEAILGLSCYELGSGDGREVTHIVGLCLTVDLLDNPFAKHTPFAEE
jgi:hypothetical protein